MLYNCNETIDKACLLVCFGYSLQFALALPMVVEYPLQFHIPLEIQRQLMPCNELAEMPFLRWEVVLRGHH